jgi:hypothetical protein
MSRNIEHDSVMAFMHSKRVWLLHIVGNALLFVAFFYWLQIKEDTGARFAVTVVAGLLIIFLSLLLHGGTFAYFCEGTDSSFISASRRVLPRLPWLLVWAVVFGIVLWLLAQMWNYDAQTGGWARHLLPEFMRKQVSPRSVISVTSTLIGFIVFFLWPIMFLPVGVQTASMGLRGMFAANAWRPVRNIHFWITYAVCFLVGAYFPYKLAYMTPMKPSPLSAQTWSMVMRLGVGYLLLVTMWLVLCAAMASATVGRRTVEEGKLGTMPLA